MSDQPVVSVRGEATIEVDPELAVLTISVESQDIDRDTTVDLLSKRARAVTDVVARFKSGIERSETSRLQVYPEFENKKKGESVRRYVGRATTHLTMHDFALLSDLIVALAAIEMVSIDGPWWRLRPDSEVYRMARLAAAEDALVRARDYAGAFGAEIATLVEIADQGMSTRYDRPLAASARFAASSSWEGQGDERRFDLEPQRQEVVGNIEARFQLTRATLSPTLRPDSP
ncbi:MAG: uncharacterized protein QOI51_1743 [Nocardioidaceae bacterium]|jgi:uncharacterized protein YggE|nr:uncharacterized protein [Nocardioidaceae bacterium]MDX6309172.1 uncharacterized protein [Nocardioidaceae bacterium]